MNQELYLLYLLVAGLGGGQSDGDDPSDNPAADQRLSDDAANNNMDLETRDPLLNLLGFILVIIVPILVYLEQRVLLLGLLSVRLVRKVFMLVLLVLFRVD
jgi:hypothetical protein